MAQWRNKKPASHVCVNEKEKARGLTDFAGAQLQG